MAVWAGAAAGVVLTLAWIDAPEWLLALRYVLPGWAGAIALPTLIATLAPEAGGAGRRRRRALHRGRRHLCPQACRPPSQPLLGYHEVFHVLVIAAAALQYAAIAFFVLPGTRG